MKAPFQYGIREQMANHTMYPAQGRYRPGPLGRDGSWMPMRQADLFLQVEQMRSPDQALANCRLHIRHCRCLADPAAAGSRSGLR